MAQLVIILGISSSMCLAAEQRSRSQDATIAQVQETLQNLLQSIEDEGRNAEGIFGPKQKWCRASIKTEGLSSKKMTDSLEQLQADLKDHEAAVDEATGTIRQIQAEMALTEHVINQTQQVLESKRAEEAADASQDKSFLQARGSRANASLIANRAEEHSRFKKEEAGLLKMLANKKQSLASMQGELEAEYPLLAQVQDLTAQTKQQIADRSESLQASGSLVSIAQDECEKSSSRAHAQDVARVSATNAIEAALQDLVATGISATKLKKTSTPLSFVQTTQITATDVLSLWPQKHAHRNLVLLSNPGSSPPVTDVKPKINELLVALKSDKGTQQEKTAWCLQEHDRNELQLKLKQDALDQLKTEITAHSDVEAQLSEDLESMDSRTAFLQKAVKEVQTLGSKEKAYTTNSGKDHQLAVRILDQALAILQDFESRATSEGYAASVAKSVGSATSSLRLAQATFVGQKKSLTGLLTEVQDGTQHVSQAVKEALQAQQQERVNIELAKDSHTQKRTRCVENMRMRESEVREATSFIQQLKEECSSEMDAEEEHRHADQVEALEDVQKTLDGQDLAPPPDADAYESEQDASEAVKAPVKVLTPMERAAQEMGVSEN